MVMHMFDPSTLEAEKACLKKNKNQSGENVEAGRRVDCLWAVSAAHPEMQHQCGSSQPAIILVPGDLTLSLASRGTGICAGKIPYT